ncbi:hypothetical protein BJ875DRAFT_438577 [Amylocarpus encephaloides]|uniref:Attractin/MKLN-like beta-propeller domain-containing protein n=1 Tax=Amylocarpus encephaloides TaxID=45428 RepID=A0A9P7YQC5_9HELO|nr:hypothetical protein BJ875DRAFT_438577 [Amylocarpus encephaloides]
MMSKYLGLLVLLAQASIQQKDPKLDFCRRYAHQTCVVDQQLFIDGGMVNYGDVSQNLSNTFLSYHDLTSSPPQIEMPELFANLSKNATVPSVSGGQLWADSVNKKFYLYGGEYYNQAPNSPQDIYTYDILNNQWNDVGAPNDGIQSVSWGAGVGVSTLGKGFVYGGWLSNTSVAGWQGPPYATNSLLQYNMATNKWTNVTGPDTIGRAEGVTVYIPSSLDGMLVNFGGVDVQPNGSISASPMNSIRLYDIRSSKWYTQTATGDEIPQNRRKFCADAAWSQDRSSYNIYLYGGMGFEANVTGYDDLWILSLPSFKWINYYKGTPGSPHHSLSCNIVNNGQMLVIGGTFPVSNACDSQIQFGVHNSDIGRKSGNQWATYNPNITTYSVPSDIVKVIGGSSVGGASLVKPAAGFQNTELEVYFKQKAEIPLRTPTRLIPGPTGNGTAGNKPVKLAAGAIAGISIGGAVVLSSIILGACFCFRRRKNNRAVPLHSPPPRSLSTSTTKALPRVPPAIPTEHLSPQSHYSHPHRQESHSMHSHYQLPTTPEPVELYGSHYRMTQTHDDMKVEGLGMRQLLQGEHPAYTPSRSPPPHHHHTNATTSPNPSTFSDSTAFTRSNTRSKRETFGSPTSIAPTFTTIGRSSRPPDTYYAP